MAFSDAMFSRVSELLPVVAANYTKRWMEHVYDNAFQTPLGQKLAAMALPKRYAVEFGLNVLASFFEDRLAENTGLKKFVKEVTVDAAPEISKRMINGAREEIVASAKTLEEKEVARLLFELEDQELIELMSWLYGISLLERRRVIHLLSLLPAEQLSRLMNFSADQKEKFIQIVFPQPEKKERGPFLSEETRGRIRNVTQAIRGARKRMRESGGKQ